MPPRSITVKLSEEEYELLQQARAELRKKGIQGAGIEDDKELASQWQDFALGAIVGIGAYLLYKSLTEKK